MLISNFVKSKKNKTIIGLQAILLDAALLGVVIWGSVSVARNCVRFYIRLQFSYSDFKSEKGVQPRLSGNFIGFLLTDKAPNLWVDFAVYMDFLNNSRESSSG